MNYISVNILCSYQNHSNIQIWRRRFFKSNKNVTGLLIKIAALIAAKIWILHLLQATIDALSLKSNLCLPVVGKIGVFGTRHWRASNDTYSSSRGEQMDRRRQETLSACNAGVRCSCRSDHR